MVDNSNDVYADPNDIKLPSYDVITPGDAPRPEHPVSRAWKVLARCVDGRYREIVVDRQDDYEHALRLVEAYTSPGEDMPGFIPDALLMRDGSAVHLLRAAQNLLTWCDQTGSGGDLVDDLRHAVAMAIDPMLDVGDRDEDKVSLRDIREASEAGARFCAGKRPRSANPYPADHPLYLHWDRGWELESIRIKTPPPSQDESYVASRAPDEKV